MSQLQRAALHCYAVLQYKDVLGEIERKTAKADELVREWQARIIAHHEVRTSTVRTGNRGYSQGTHVLGMV
jgi:hypothetical protein